MIVGAYVAADPSPDDDTIHVHQAEAIVMNQAVRAICGAEVHVLTNHDTGELIRLAPHWETEEHACRRCLDLVRQA